MASLRRTPIIHWLAAVAVTAVVSASETSAAAQVGVPFAVTFAVTGVPKSASSYTVSGLPPGLAVPDATFSAGTNTYLVNAPFTSITGAPTAAGNFSLTITGWELVNGMGVSRSYSYSIAVSPSTNLVPVFTTQPASQNVNEGSSVIFSTAASGPPAPTYQWRKGGVALSGETGNTLRIANTLAGDAGTYLVVATNSAGSTTSDSVTLTVNPLTSPPVITTQPLDRTTIVGSAVTFTAMASGTPAPTYQWRKDGIAISGASSANYAIAKVGAGDAGAYSVVATNSAGAATSVSAQLVLDTIPAGFDVNAYLVRYPAVAAVYGTDGYGAWLYYREHGIFDGQVYDDLFRVEEYLTLYPELFALFGDDLGGALLHWLTQGSIEGRLGRIPLEFSATGYFARNPDVATAASNDPLLAWVHFWLYGIYEGRAYDDELRVFEYLAINADLTAAFVADWRQAALHWMRFGRTEGRLGRLPLIFNVTEYLNRNPDVSAAWGTNPTTVFLHFWLYGINEGRTFDDLFRVDEYLALNPDLAAVFGPDRRGAFKHWVRYGMAEGRAGRNP